MSSHSKIFTFACPTNSFWSLMALASSTATGDFKLNPSMRLKTKTGAQCPRPVCEGASPSFQQTAQGQGSGLGSSLKARSTTIPWFPASRNICPHSSAATAGPWSTAATVTQAAAFQQEPTLGTSTVCAAQGSMSIKGLLEFARVSWNTESIKRPWCPKWTVLKIWLKKYLAETTAHHPP